MFKWTRIAGVVVAAVGWMGNPLVAVAGGMNLAWNDCLGEGGGVQNANFACDTNSGSHLLVGSFITDRDVDLVQGTECQIEIATASASLPMWWAFRQPGACRTNSMSANNIFDVNDVVCEDWTQGQTALFTTYAVGERGPSTARITVGVSIERFDFVRSAQIQAGHEYVFFNVVISHAKTVGADCNGCTVPACLVLNGMQVLHCDPESIGESGCRSLTHTITGAAGPGTNFVTWQGGGSPTVGGVTGCPAATATRRATWTQVRALYR